MGNGREAMTAPEKPVMRVRRLTLLRQAGCNGGSTIAEPGGPSGKSSDSMKSIQSTDSILSIPSTGLGSRLEVMTAPEILVMRVRRLTLLRQAGYNGGSTIAEPGGPIWGNRRIR